MKIEDELNQYRQRDLKSYRESDVVKYVEILAANDSCERCKNWAGQKIKLEDATKENILPIPGCNHQKGYCRCTYIPVV